MFIFGKEESVLALAICLGALMIIIGTVASEYKWYTRAGWITGGLALMAIVLYFVITG